MDRDEAYEIVVADGAKILLARKLAYDAYEKWVAASDELRENNAEVAELLSIQDQYGAFKESCKLAGLDPDDPAFAVHRRVFHNALLAELEEEASRN